MRPVSVEFQAFGPYAGKESVDFGDFASDGLFLICGKTGTGKTTILDAMTFALYGKSSGHGRDELEAMRCSKAAIDTPTYVRFIFENRGKFYRFERRLEHKRTKFSRSCDFSIRNDEGVFEPLFQNPKEKDLNLKAVEITGLEYDQFRQVVILPQGQFEKLLTSNSDDKEKILSNIFGISKWDEIAGIMYEKAAEKKQRYKEVENTVLISLREEECESIEMLEEKINGLEKLKASIEEEYKKAQIEKKIALREADRGLIKLFSDLKEERAKEKALLERKARINIEKQRLEAALRADRLKAPVSAAAKASEDLKARTGAAEKAVKDAGAAKERVIEINKKLEGFLKGGEAINEAGELRNRYENAKPVYSRADALAAELEKALKEEKEIKKKIGESELFLRKTAEAALEQKEIYTKAQTGYGGLLNAYIAGIAGELSSKLKDGMPCPVCGSETHPAKACIDADFVSKEELDAAEKEAEREQAELNILMEKHKEAETSVNKLKEEAAGLSAAAVAAAKNLEEARKELIEGIGSVKELDERIRKIDEEISAYNKQKETLEKEALRLGKEETQAAALIEPSEQEKSKAEKALKDAKKMLEEALSANGFADIKEAEAMFLTDEEKDDINREINNYISDVKANSNIIEKLGKELEGKEEPDPEAVEKELRELKEASVEYTKKLTSCSDTVSRLSAKLQHIKDMSEGIREKMIEAENDFKFAKALRGDSGTGLQRYVLGIMFSSVIAAANKMLENVHGGRYRLFRSDDKAAGTNKRGLELKVFDKMSGDAEGRFVGTLSGGEKFLASLALSIGMSSVASRSGIRTEALFIDEGFGSLDENSIEDAMNVLAGVRDANGLVGIISHVKLLEERIPAKLRIEVKDRKSHIISDLG